MSQGVYIPLGGVNKSLKRLLGKNVTLRGMTIAFSSPGDGNCFFSSVLHQLQLLNMETGISSHRQLRQRLAQFLTNLVRLAFEFSSAII